MTINENCPAPDELKQMLLGRMPPARMVVVEDHLDRCPRCIAILDAVEVESQIVDALKSPPAKREVVPDLERMMANLETLHPDVGSATADSVGRRDDFPRLLPSNRPGELGRLAHFRIIELLGAGGMGVVYRAHDTKLERAVALKVLRPRTAQDPDARDRFLREARAIASIKHDHVVVVHDVGEAPSDGDDITTPYLAMELLDGVSLESWMSSHPRPPLLAVVRLGRQIAEALAALHARSLVHRDVKPGNLWLESSTHAAGPPGKTIDIGKLKLLDFGLVATSSDAFAESRTLGTPAYMAPEQFRGESVDARSDLFSLGCVLYELCTNELPFPDRRFTEPAVPLPAGDINPAVPRALANLIGRMLRENSADRPESARSVVRELTAIESALAGDTPEQLRGSRFRSAALASAAGLALIVGGILYFTPRASVSPVASDPIMDSWCAEIRRLPSKEQWHVVVAKLEELNPGYSPSKITGWIEPEAVIRFSESSDHLHDIHPIGCLSDLKTVFLRGTTPQSGLLTDLTPLQSLQLHKLGVNNNPKLRNLAPLKKMPLFVLYVGDTAVDSLADLSSLPLTVLGIPRTAVKDLSPLTTMSQLREFECNGCPIETIEPLRRTSLQVLSIDYQPARDAAVLKSLTSLQQINGLPIQEFWRNHPE